MRTAWLVCREIVLPTMLILAVLYLLGFIGLVLDQALSEPWL